MARPAEYMMGAMDTLRFGHATTRALRPAANALLAAQCLVSASTHAAGTPHPSVLIAPASAASSAQAESPRVSPYAVVARQHTQAASAPAQIHSVSPTMRRTRVPSGQQVQR
jgi:hypothetical protein